MKKKILLTVVLLAFIFQGSCAPQSAVSVTPGLSEETAILRLTPSPATEGQAAVPVVETLPAETVSSEMPVLNPLTHLPMSHPDDLAKRPLIIKIQNVPRESRPQWGLSLADHVYEYAIESGDTRFAAVYYANRPEQAGPVRSARHIDMQIIQMYSGVLLFGGAYEELMESLLSAEFGKNLIREGPNTEPAFYRYDPKGVNALMVNTTLLGPVYEKYGIEDIQPQFTPLAFSDEGPVNGPAADVVFTRFSGSMYNRWDYDPGTRRYYRSSEIKSGLDEEYAPLYDQLTGRQIAADNLVILFTRYNQVENENQVFDVPMIGSGKAYAARDGMINALTWKREASDQLLELLNENGTAYSFKPGTIWYSVFGSQSKLEQQDRNWKFTLYMP